LTRPTTTPVEQHIHVAADRGTVEGGALLAEQRLKPRQPLFFSAVAI